MYPDRERVFKSTKNYSLKGAPESTTTPNNCEQVGSMTVLVIKELFLKKMITVQANAAAARLFLSRCSSACFLCCTSSQNLKTRPDGSVGLTATHTKHAASLTIRRDSTSVGHRRSMTTPQKSGTALKSTRSFAHSPKLHLWYSIMYTQTH